MGHGPVIVCPQATEECRRKTNRTVPKGTLCVTGPVMVHLVIHNIFLELPRIKDCAITGASRQRHCGDFCGYWYEISAEHRGELHVTHPAIKSWRRTAIPPPARPSNLATSTDKPGSTNGVEGDRARQ